MAYSGPKPVPAEVHAFPVDVSVYGVRGVAGNIHQRCLDLEATVQANRVVAPLPAEGDELRHARRSVAAREAAEPVWVAVCGGQDAAEPRVWVSRGISADLIEPVIA